MDKKELFVTKALIEARGNSLKRLFAIMRQRTPCAPCVLYAAMSVFGLWFRLVSLQLFLHKRQQSAAHEERGRPGRTRPPAFSSRYCVCAKAAPHEKALHFSYSRNEGQFKMHPRELLRICQEQTAGFLALFYTRVAAASMVFASASILIAASPLPSRAARPR